MSGSIILGRVLDNDGALERLLDGFLVGKFEVGIIEGIILWRGEGRPVDHDG